MTFCSLPGSVFVSRVLKKNADRLSDILVIGVSTRALFNLETENEVFNKKGVVEFRKYQLEHGVLLVNGQRITLRNFNHPYVLSRSIGLMITPAYRSTL